jgi:hypothetical protein
MRFVPPCLDAGYNPNRRSTTGSLRDPLTLALL